jgi:hypothetical protein
VKEDRKIDSCQVKEKGKGVETWRIARDMLHVVRRVLARTSTLLDYRSSIFNLV